MNRYPTNNDVQSFSRAELEATQNAGTFRLVRNSIIFGLLALFLAIISIRCAVSVDAGTRYIVTSFGRTTGDVLMPGLHFIAPWQSGERVNVQLREIKESMETPTAGGLQVTLESSLWVGLDPKPEALVRFVNNVGVTGVNDIITSAKRSVTRDAIAGYTYEDLYSSNRMAASEKIFNGVKDVLEPKGILVDRVLLRGVTPPPSTRDAQERKASAEQASEAMKFVIEKERQEVTRKEREAQGIAKANLEISKSLTAEYLQWYYIKAIEGLAHSTNTTFLVLPYDSKLTPMLNVNNK